MKKEKDLEGLALSQSNDIQPSAIHNHDDVFGEITESGPNYRNVCLFFSSALFLLSFIIFLFILLVKCQTGSRLTPL